MLMPWGVSLCEGLGARRRSEETMEWQPIETAPKDGDQVLLRVAARFHKRTAHFAAQGYWACDHWVIFNADEAVQRVEPNHWMPLPDPPESAPNVNSTAPSAP